MPSSEDSFGPRVERFLCQVMEDIGGGRVVTVERKGTALMRVYLEELPQRGSWSWEDVISNEVLKYRQVSARDLAGKVILILEDTIRTGDSIKRAKRQLLKTLAGEAATIKTAAIAVHKDSQFRPDYGCFRGLDDTRYEEIRLALVKYLQRQGSLLLDTEHIEVPLELVCSLREFGQALTMVGDVVEFLSGDGHTNFTLSNPFMPDEDDFWRRMPEGASEKPAVRKVRIRERKPGIYGVIPILYVPVPLRLPDGWNSGLPDCVRFSGGDPELNFHSIGIYGSMRLLEGVFMALRDLLNSRKVKCTLPKPGAPGDPLSHLRAFFRSLDVEALHREMSTVIERGRVRGLREGERTPGAYLVDGVDVKLREVGFELRSTILAYKDRFEFLAGIQGIPCSNLADGFRGTNGATVGAAADVEIDNARVVPDDVSILFPDGIERHTRIFRLDNEIDEGNTRVEKRYGRGAKVDLAQLIDATATVSANVVANRLDHQGEMWDQEADKLLRLMCKCWDWIAASGKLSVTRLPIRKDYDDKHGRRVVLDTERKPPLLKVIRRHDDPLRPKYLAFDDSPGAHGKRFYKVAPAITESKVKEKVGLGVITADDANLSHAIGVVAGALKTDHEVICIGRHDTPGDTLHDIACEFDRWRLWTRDLMKALRDPSLPPETELADDNASYDIEECAFQMWTFAEEAVRKSELDRVPYADALARIAAFVQPGRYHDDVPLGQVMELVKDTVIRNQPAAEQIWQDRRVMYESIPAHMCHSYSNYVTGILVGLGRLEKFHPRAATGQVEVSRAYAELCYLLSLDSKSLSLSHLYSDELTRFSQELHAPPAVAVVDPGELRGGTSKYESFLTAASRCYQHIWAQFVKPEVDKYSSFEAAREAH